jgi:NTP pyrophosphatase (non-canonical NTP hydrolase)
MNKSFEVIEKVLVHMGDNFYQPVTFPEYTNKLSGEVEELLHELELPITKNLSSLMDKVDGDISLYDKTFIDHHNRVKDELADVLCFLLRISNKLNLTASRSYQNVKQIKRH